MRYANEIVNAAIDAERTFKCKWPNLEHIATTRCHSNHSKLPPKTSKRRFVMYYEYGHLP